MHLLYIYSYSTSVHLHAKKQDSLAAMSWPFAHSVHVYKVSGLAMLCWARFVLKQRMCMSVQSRVNVHDHTVVTDYS